MKYLSLILSISVLLLSVMPCCLEDKCLSVYAETAETGDDMGNCSDDSCCSPFLHCNTCSGFPEARSYNFISIKSNLVSDYKSDYIESNNLPDYKSSIWQPPKA